MKNADQGMPTSAAEAELQEGHTPFSTAFACSIPVTTAAYYIDIFRMTSYPPFCSSHLKLDVCDCCNATAKVVAFNMTSTRKYYKPAEDIGGTLTAFASGIVDGSIQPNYKSEDVPTGAPTPPRRPTLV